MTNNRSFWIVQMIAVLALYAAALVLALTGQAAHAVVRIALLFLAAHVLEMPLAFHFLKARNPQALRVVAATLLFGLLWWVPARRGIFAVR